MINGDDDKILEEFCKEFDRQKVKGEREEIEKFQRKSKFVVKFCYAHQKCHRSFSFHSISCHSLEYSIHESAEWTAKQHCHSN